MAITDKLDWTKHGDGRNTHYSARTDYGVRGYIRRNHRQCGERGRRVTDVYYTPIIYYPGGGSVQCLDTGSLEKAKASVQYQLDNSLRGIIRHHWKVDQ